MHVFHGCAADAAERIRKEGVIVEKSMGGNWGAAFYVAENARETHGLAQCGDSEPGQRFVVLEFELDRSGVHGAVLDFRSSSDWDTWVEVTNGLHCSQDGFAAEVARRGIAAICDYGGCGGYAVFVPRVLTLLGEHKTD